MLLSNAIRDLSNLFREGEKLALDAEIQREIQRGFAGEVESCERLERLIDQRARLVREIERASLRPNFPVDACNAS